MSGVFPPGTRPDEWRTLGDHQRRIQALEATKPTGSDTAVGTPPLTLLELGSGTQVSAPVVVDTAAADFTVTLAASEGIRVERISIDGGTEAGTYAYLRQIDMSLLGSFLGVYDLTGTWEIGDFGALYGSNLTVNVGESSSYFRVSDVINGGEGSTITIDQTRLTSPFGSLAVDASFVGRDYDVTLGGGSGSAFVDRIQITGGDGNDLDGWATVLDALGSGHAQNTLTVSAVDGDATGLILKASASGGGVAKALVCLDGSGNPAFEVWEDGTVHIKTGGTIVADL